MSGMNKQLLARSTHKTAATHLSATWVTRSTRWSKRIPRGFPGQLPWRAVEATKTSQSTSQGRVESRFKTGHGRNLWIFRNFRNRNEIKSYQSVNQPKRSKSNCPFRLIQSRQSMKTTSALILNAIKMTMLWTKSTSSSAIKADRRRASGSRTKSCLRAIMTWLKRKLERAGVRNTKRPSR